MNASSFVPDDLWEAIEPLLPEEPPKPKGGRPRVPDRAALAGIVFVLRTGCPWRLLPKELGCGSGTTCWRRLRDWQEAGVWERLHETLLNWLGDEGIVDWSRASLDSVSVRAKRGASRPGRTPSDRGKPGSKYHLVVDRDGIPLAVRLSAANAHDSTKLLPLVDAVPPDRRSTGETGPAPEAPGQAARRQGLRLCGLTPCPAGSRHHAASCTPRDRVQRAARAAPLGRRAHARLAARLSAPGRPLRTACRPAPGPAPPRLRADLPALPPPRGAREVGP